jgi:hypothetical protein
MIRQASATPPVSSEGSYIMSPANAIQSCNQERSRPSRLGVRAHDAIKNEWSCLRLDREMRKSFGNRNELGRKARTPDETFVRYGETLGYFPGAGVRNNVPEVKLADLPADVAKTARKALSSANTLVRVAEKELSRLYPSRQVPGTKGADK